MVEQKYKILKKTLVFMIIFIAVLSILNYNNTSNTIIIGTKNFTEQRLVAEMIKIYVEEETGYDVEIKSGLGDTVFLHQAILDQDIDLYVDYSSNGFQGVLHQTYENQSSEEINSYLKEEYNEQFDLDWISFLGFENTNALICLDYCIENNINTIDELSSYDFSLGAPQNFYVRSDGYVILEDNYNFDISENNKLKMDPTLIYSGVSSGDLDVGLAFTTDGRIQTDNYTVMYDTKNAFPKYDAGIVVNNDSIDEFTNLDSALLKFDDLISTQEMSELNKRVDIDGEDITDVATDYLKEKGLIN